MSKTIQLSRPYTVSADSEAPAFHMLPAHDLSAFYNYLARNRAKLGFHVMVDVGADIGLATLNFLDSFDDGRVIAIEADAGRLAGLSSTLHLNGLSSRVTLVCDRPEVALADLQANGGLIYLAGGAPPIERLSKVLKHLVDANAVIFFRLNLPALDKAGQTLDAVLGAAEAAFGRLGVVDDLTGLISTLESGDAGVAQLRAIQRGPSEVFSLVSQPQQGEADPAPPWSDGGGGLIGQGGVRQIRSIGDIVDDVDLCGEYAHRCRRTPSIEWVGKRERKDVDQCAMVVPGAVMTSCYLVVDPGHRRLFGNQSYVELSNWFIVRPRLEAGRYEFRSNNVISLAGRHAVIGGPIDNAYYHWLLSWAPRLVLLKALWPELYGDPELKFAIDRRALQEPYASFIRFLGVEPDRITYVDDINDYVLDEAVLVSFPAQTTYYPQLIGWFVDALRERLPPSAVPRKRILISRQKFTTPKRRIANLAEIAPILAAFGFEEVVLEDMGVEEQIALFSSAEAVIGVHGAGLVNLIFCAPDCRVVLLEHRRNADLGLAGMFAVLADVVGLVYDTVMVEEVIEPGVDYSAFGDVHNRDVVVPPHRLDIALSRMLSRVSQDRE